MLVITLASSVFVALFAFFLAMVLYDVKKGIPVSSQPRFQFVSLCALSFVLGRLFLGLLNLVLWLTEGGRCE